MELAIIMSLNLKRRFMMARFILGSKSVNFMPFNVLFSASHKYTFVFYYQAKSKKANQIN